MTEARYEGEAVKIGDREFIVPSLSIKQARTLWPKILELDRGVTVDTFPDNQLKAVEIIHAALSRNYPELTVDEVEDLVDMKNLRQLMLIVSGQSGLKPRAGAGPAATPSLTGPESTGPSSREPAGPSST